MSVTFVQRLRTVTFALIIAIPLVAAIATAAIAAPRPAATVSGVAVEASRDVNRSSMAPVEYSFNGSQRVEFVYSRAVAGEVVVFDVDAEGNPDSRSWWSLVFFVAMVGGFLAIIGFILWFFLEDTFDELDARARRDSYLRTIYA